MFYILGDKMPTVKSSSEKFIFANSHYVQVSKNRVITKPDSLKVLKRVLKLFTFCALLPGFFLIVPLYLRFRIYVQQIYPIGISDMRLIDKHISTIWCQSQSIETNTTFNAYVIPGEPRLSKTTNKINMRRSMKLKDGSKEYWGFYLLKGSSFKISSCTRFPGASLIIIEGHHNLKECVYEGDRSSEENNSISSEEHNNVTILDRMTKIMPDMILYRDIRNNQSSDETQINEVFLTSNKTQNAHLRYAEEFTQKNKKRYALRTNNKKNELKKLNNSFDGKHKEMQSQNQLLNNKILKTNNTPNEEDIEFNKIKKDILINRKQKYLKEDVEDEIDDTAAEIFDVEEKNDVHGAVSVLKEGDRSKSEVWSSISSSEERILTCKGLFASLPLIPNKTCEFNYDTNHLDIISKLNSIAYVTKSTGYYFFIFNNENEIHDNFIHAHFEINKKIYDTSNHIKACENKTRVCSLPLTFWSDEKTILELPKPDNDKLWNEEFLVKSRCEPRTILYFICAIFVPFSILLYALT